MVILGAIIGGFGNGAVAQAQNFGPTPSPPGATVYFIDPKDNATIPTTSVIHFGLKNMGVAPAGSDRPNSGHHHLLIDTELPPLDQPIPSDFNHLHFGAGQTEAEITLTPGEHTLQLLMGDKNHIPHNPPVVSDRIRVFVVDNPPSTAQAAAPSPAPAPPPPSPQTPPPSVPMPAMPPMGSAAAPPAPPSVPVPAVPPTGAAAATPSPPPPALLPFAAALLKASNDLFSKVPLGEGRQKLALVIDPLIDGASGAQSSATQEEQKTIVQLVQSKYPRFEINPFDASSLASSPLVLIGTLTAINNSGRSEGPRDAYRICLALADLRTNKIVSKGVARSTPDGISPAPSSFFSESPVFVKEPVTDGYVQNCQSTKVGDPINKTYLESILASSLVAKGIESYNSRQYKDALDLYQSALRAPGGEQLRTLNGIYLASSALGHGREAQDAFARLIDYGLKTDHLAVKLLFRAGSTQFAAEQRNRPLYAMWLKVIAGRASTLKSCLEIVGHTSATGLPDLNDRLSALRADTIKDRLITDAAELRQRLIATGRGSREMIVGTGKDDASDALDRRVEFKVVPC